MPAIITYTFPSAETRDAFYRGLNEQNPRQDTLSNIDVHISSTMPSDQMMIEYSLGNIYLVESCRVPNDWTSREVG